MQDDPSRPVSSDELIRAARQEVGLDESLSERMLRDARTRVEAAIPLSSAERIEAGRAAPAAAEPDMKETTSRPSAPKQRPVPPPPTKDRSRPRRDKRRQPVSQPSSPFPADQTRRRIPKAARGLIPLIIFGVIFLSNFFDDEGGGEPDVVPAADTVVTQATTGVEVRSDEPSVNLAFGAPVAASGETPDGPATNAVDGEPQTPWNAGAYAPQWIEIDLGAPSVVREVRLRVGQSPSTGETVHAVLARGPGTDGEEYLFYGFEGPTTDNTWISAKPNDPWSGIQFIRVFTLDSPSWVSWFEVEVLGVPEQ